MRSNTPSNGHVICLRDFFVSLLKVQLFTWLIPSSWSVHLNWPAHSLSKLLKQSNVLWLKSALLVSNSVYTGLDSTGKSSTTTKSSNCFTISPQTKKRQLVNPLFIYSLKCAFSIFLFLYCILFRSTVLVWSKALPSPADV